MIRICSASEFWFEGFSLNETGVLKHPKLHENNSKLIWLISSLPEEWIWCGCWLQVKSIQDNNGFVPTKVPSVHIIKQCNSFWWVTEDQFPVYIVIIHQPINEEAQSLRGVQIVRLLWWSWVEWRNFSQWAFLRGSDTDFQCNEKIAFCRLSCG